MKFTYGFIANSYILLSYNFLRLTCGSHREKALHAQHCLLTLLSFASFFFSSILPSTIFPSPLPPPTHPQ